jgi:hypothetical protein
MDADFWLSNLSRIDFRDFFLIILSTSFILTCHCDLLLEFLYYIWMSCYCFLLLPYVHLIIDKQALPVQIIMRTDVSTNVVLKAILERGKLKKT